jgi:hypothetical protein
MWPSAHVQVPLTIKEVIGELLKCSASNMWIYMNELLKEGATPCDILGLLGAVDPGAAAAHCCMFLMAGCVSLAACCT